MSRVYNQSLAQLMKSQSRKTISIGTVPLAHPDKAAQVLNEAMNIGLKGAIIGPGIRSTYAFRSFFQTIF